MIFRSVVTIALTASSAVSAFGLVSSNSPIMGASTTTTTRSTNLHMSMPPMPDPERMKKIMEEESQNPENLKASAEMLKNLNPEDLDNMLSQMDNMPAAQREQMVAMGMNPDLMRKSVEMMKSNPEMAKQMANMMENMTPDQIMDKSRLAQQAFESANPPAASVVDAQVVANESTDNDEEDDDEDPIPPPDADVLDTLYRTAELMSSPPTGMVTLAGFSAVPPVSLLIGTDSERDVSLSELKECWADGSLGAARVDRAGFERVLVEVQEYFSAPVIEKGRQRALGQKAAAAASAPAAPVVSSPVVGAPVVGDAVSDAQMEQVKNMSETDMDAMLGQMQNMTPAMQDQMKAMGVDPKMMQKTADMMNNNPLMKNAAKMMMKNMSADQMRKASQQAQEQMAKMTPQEREEAIKRLENQAKQ